MLGASEVDAVDSLCHRLQAGTASSSIQNRNDTNYGLLLLMNQANAYMNT